MKTVCPNCGGKTFIDGGADARPCSRAGCIDGFIDTEYPRVIWMGSEPLKSRGRFRLVDRGPARQGRPDDVPFSLEKNMGFDMMKCRSWGPIAEGQSAQYAIWALAHAFGLLLTVDPKKLNLEHPLFCEINLAIAEDRESKGCDCGRPADPLEK